MLKSKMFQTFLVLILAWNLSACATSGAPPASTPHTQEYYGAAISLIESQSMAMEGIEKETTALKKELEELKEQVQLSAVSQTISSSETLSLLNTGAPAKTIVVEHMLSAAAVPVETHTKAIFSRASAENSTSSTAAEEKENAGTIFEGYTVLITDSKTPAKMALGIDWPITKLYFMADNGDHLGSISGVAYEEIMEKYKTHKPGEGLWYAPGANGDWEFWFAEEFNALRGISSDSSNSTKKKEADTAKAALEVVSLTNEERDKIGVGTLDIDEHLMELAQTRAEEISEQFSHIRPDGIRISELGYGENISYGRTSSDAVIDAWMNSSRHKSNMLNEKYKYMGVGCFVKNNTYYWVQLFSWEE